MSSSALEPPELDDPPEGEDAAPQHATLVARQAPEALGDKRWPPERGADLRNVDLSNRDLRHADLVRCDLRGACLDGADL